MGELSPDFLATNNVLSSALLPETEERHIDTRLIKGVGRIARANVPYVLEIPDEVIDPVPLLLVHGYLGTEDFYAPLREHIASSGKPAITYESSRVQGLLSGWHPKHLAHPERLLSQEVWATMKSVMARDDTGLDTKLFDLSGHSMGGLTSAAVAERRPEHVRSVIFNASAGLERHNLLKMISRLPAFHREELVPAILNGELMQFTDTDVALRAIYHIYRSIRRTIAEGITVAGSNNHSSLLEMAAHGTKSAILAYKRDRLCPPEEMLRDGAHRVDLSVLLDNPRAGHLAPQIYPDEVAHVHLQILEALNSKPEDKFPPMILAA